MRYFKLIYLKTVVFAAVATGGCSAFSPSAADNRKPSNAGNGNAVATAIKSNKPMTINFGKISFTVPNGFPVPEGYENSGQSSGYEKASQFKTAADARFAESLEAGWEFESSKSLEALNAEVKENMQNTGVYTIEKDTDRTIDGYPAKIMQATAKNDKEPSAQVFIAHIKSGEKKFVRVYYDTQAPPAEAQAVFDRIVSSITFNRNNGGKPKTPTAENFRRYDAGDLSLDVPTTMSPKQTPGAKTLRIEQLPEENWNTEQIVYTVSYFGEEDVKTKPDLVKEIENSQAPDAVVGQKQDSFDTENFKGELTRLSVNVPELENAEGKTAVLIAEGRTKDSTTVQLKGESPFSKRNEMESGFREILNSIKSPQ